MKRRKTNINRSYWTDKTCKLKQHLTSIRWQPWDLSQKTVVQGVDSAISIYSRSNHLSDRQTVAVETVDQVELSYIAAISCTLLGHSSVWYNLDVDSADRNNSSRKRAVRYRRRCSSSRTDFSAQHTLVRRANIQGRRHGFESGGTNAASGASRKFFWPPTFWPVGGLNIA